MPFDDPDLSPIGLPRLLICGRLPAGEEKLRIDVVQLPRYQALACASEAARSVPWLTLTSASSIPCNHAAAPLAPDDCRTLAEALENTDWVLLAAATVPVSLALATAIAAEASRQEADVAVFLTESAASPAFDDALLASCRLVCRCPSTVSPLLAAEVLWSSVMCQGLVGVDISDLRICLNGAARLHVAPMRQDGPERVRALLSQLDDIGNPRGLWAVLVLPDNLDLQEFTEVGDYLHDDCSEDTAVVIAAPTITTLPYGLYLFTC